MKKQKRCKVATMTFHIAHNHGAMLQAFALERAVRSMEISCEVLDYRFAYIDQWSGLRSMKDLWQEFGPIGLMKYAWRRLRGAYRRIDPARKKFDQFMRKELHLSSKTYFCPESLANADYDVILLGSDQIWNSNLTDGPAPEYMGKYFDNRRTRLVAYGASSGTDHLDASWNGLSETLLKRFYRIGIREKALAQHISQTYGLETKTVLDPVFLPDRSVWDALADDAQISVDEPYVLIYAFENGDSVYECARKIARQKGLTMVAINYKADGRCEDMLQLTDCGPKDFVRLIRDAQFVCTTSFHGTAFSVVFKKDFYCFGHPKYSQRNLDLLEAIGLQDRMLDEAGQLPDPTGCDYLTAEKKLQKLREESFRFLSEALFIP